MGHSVRMIVRGLGVDHSILFEVTSFGLYKAEDVTKLYRDACWVPGVVTVTFTIGVSPSDMEERRSSSRG